MPKPVAIRDIVGAVLENLDGTKAASCQDIAAALKSALDAKAFKHVQPQQYKDNKLTINVDSSAWLYKLNLEKNQILRKINSTLPKAGIKDLLFRIGNI